jgi:type I restriction enzyme R subunit
MICSIQSKDQFRSLGNATELFRDNLDNVRGIIQVIDRINHNTDEFEGA